MTVTAIKKNQALPTFEDEDVAQSHIRVTGAGDGLSDALKIEPKALHLGDEIFLVLRGKVTQVNHQQKDVDEPVVRVHTIKAGDVAEIDPDLAKKLIAEDKDRIEQAKAAAAGQLSLQAEAEAAAREAKD